MDLNDKILKTIVFMDYLRWLALVYATFRYAYYITNQRQQLRSRVHHSPTQSTIERERVRDELMNYLRMSDKCYNIVRMRPHAFQGFCDILQRDGGLQDTQWASVEKQVAKFLHIISHNVKNRTISFFFRRSGETVSRHFHRVLRSVIKLKDQFLLQPDGS